MALTLLAKVKKLLDNIGTNGTAALEPAIPPTLKGKNEQTSEFIDNHKLLHEFYLIDYVYANINKRRDNIKKELVTRFDDKLKSTPGDTRSERFDSYVVHKQVKTPAKRFNEVKLADALRKKGWSQVDIDNLVEDCKVESKAAVTWTVTSLQS